jgi:pimeloyl-ACP methyl ester carboxylesterase
MGVTTELSEADTSRYIDLGELRLHYNEIGQGPALVMLHGAGPGASSWSNFRQNLPSLADRFRVLLVDQPGFGRSGRPVSKNSPFRAGADAVHQLFDVLGIDRASFVGNSLGGGTALQFALDHPDRTDRLVLMAPGGGAYPILSPIDVTSHVGALLGEFFAAPSIAAMKKFLEVMLFDPTLITPDIVEERWLAASRPEAAEGFRHMVDVALSGAIEPRDLELWREVDRIQHPTLLIWGRDDRVLPLDGAFLLLRRMRDARLHVFPNCGHWAQVEHRAEFDRLVGGFLS